jgi:predicted RNA-binding protein with PIN domain
VTTEVPPVPEALLAPLLDDAAAVLRSLPFAEIPPSLRAVAAFDARGLARGPARRQLLRAFDDHAGYREQVAARFLGRDDVRRVLATWSPADALRIVHESMDSTALPVLVSTLYAARPAAWAFAVGVACEAGTNEARVRAIGREADARAAERASALEGRARAEAALAEAERTVHHLEQERRDERRTRRRIDDEHDAERAAAERVRAELEEAVAEARAAEARATAAVAGATGRATALERELAAARAEELAPAPAPPALDVGALRVAAEEAHRLADRLESLADDAASARAGRAQKAPPPPAAPGMPPAPAPAPGRRRARPRRNQPPCPPGLVVDTPAGLDAVLRIRGVLLLVDGYNVSKTAWPGATPEEQRTRLVAALAELHLRLRGDIVVAFDGAEVRGVPLPRRAGVRVMFSGADEEADDVVVAEAGAPPRTVPVVVATNDAALRRRAEAEGAVTVGSGTLLSVLRR